MKKLILILIFVVNAFSFDFTYEYYVTKYDRKAWNELKAFTMYAEHGGKVPCMSARSKTGAIGEWQITTRTANDVLKKHTRKIRVWRHGKLVKMVKKHPLIKGITKWNWQYSKTRQARIALLYYMDIKKFLKKKRIKPTSLKMWLVYNQGPTGFMKIYKYAVYNKRCNWTPKCRVIQKNIRNNLPNRVKATPKVYMVYWYKKHRNFKKIYKGK